MTPAALTTWLRRPWVWIVLGLVLLGCAGATLRFAPMFFVEHVQVRGNEQVSVDEVLAAADVPQGEPLLVLPVDDVVGRIESLDAVASVRITRDWPDTVTISVKERRPVGYVEGSGSFGLVGSDGSIYREQDHAPTDVPRLPPISASAGAEYPGDAGDSAAAAFAVAGSLSPRLQRSVASISADSPRAVRLVFGDGVVVDWGGVSGGQQKSDVVELIRQRPGWGTTITHVDVSAPDAPAWG